MITLETKQLYGYYTAGPRTTTLGSLNAGSNDNRLLLVFVAFGGTSGATLNGTLKYNGVALTRLSYLPGPYGSYGGMALYYLENPSSGANNLTSESFGMGDSSAKVYLYAYCLSGVDVSSAESWVDTYGHTSTQTTFSKEITTTVPNTFLISFLGCSQYNDSTVTNKAEETYDWGGYFSNADVQGGSSHIELASSGAYTTSKTVSDPHLGGVIYAIAVKPVSLPKGNFFQFLT